MRAAIVRVAVVCLLVVTSSLAAAPVSSLESDAASTYDLDVVGSISTPEETIEIEGDRYTIDGIGVVEPGDPIEIDVTSEKDYQLFLYNSDMQDEYHDTWSADAERVAMGTADDPLDTSDLQPGTYMLSLSPKGEGRQAVYPVVIQAFDLRLDYPRSATQGETIELGATADSSASSVTGVEIALWDESTDSVIEVPLESDGDGSYSGTLELDGAAEGEYEIYGAALGDEEIDGQSVPIAVSNGATMTVSDGGDDEPDDGDDESDDAETPGNETDDANETETVEDPVTDTEDNETESNGTDDGDEDGDTDDVLDPSDEPDNETVTNDGDDALGTPGAGFVALVLFLGTVVVSGRRRSNGR